METQWIQFCARDGSVTRRIAGHGPAWSDDKLLIKPSKEAVKSLLEKVDDILSRNGNQTVGYMIGHLNALLRGWANYHRHVVSKKLFDTVDWLIFKKLWVWAKRRHSNKSAGWVYRKYWQPHGHRQRVFQGKITSSDGQKKEKDGVVLCPKDPLSQTP